jgi:hypothetical protein
VRRRKAAADAATEAAAHAEHRTWTAVVTVPGYVPVMAARSDRDAHDDQIMAAAHEAVRLMRASGTERGTGMIDLFRDTEGLGNESVEQRSVHIDEQGRLVVSADLKGW